AEIQTTHKLLHVVGGRARILRSQSNELYITSRVILPDLLVFRDLSATWPTPRGPKIYYDDLVTEISETKAAAIESLDLPVQNTLREDSAQSNRFNRRCGLWLRWRRRKDRRLDRCLRY